jgi:4-hydroxythreonine-4-phosphate dehydrogenase
MNSELPILAITMGDPGGIGPEIIAKALGHARVRETSRPLVIGERRAMEAALRITHSELRLRVVDEAAQAGAEAGVVDLLDLHNIDIEQHGRGRVTAEVGQPPTSTSTATCSRWPIRLARSSPRRSTKRR